MLSFIKTYSKDRQTKGTEVTYNRVTQRLMLIYDNDKPEKEKSFNYYVN